MATLRAMKFDKLFLASGVLVSAEMPNSAYLKSGDFLFLLWPTLLVCRKKMVRKHLRKIVSAVSSFSGGPDSSFVLITLSLTLQGISGYYIF